MHFVSRPVLPSYASSGVGHQLLLHRRREGEGFVQSGVMHAVESWVLGAVG
jgi:hypothetical protein